MLFNDWKFLALFLPVVLFGAFAVFTGRMRTPFLVVSSIVFYSLSGLEHAVVLVICILWVWWLTRHASFERNPWALALAVAVPLAVLFYFKYLGFFFRDVLGLDTGLTAAMLPVLDDATLPAGISFFTFQLVAFAVDRYRGEIAAGTPLRNFALFISFFPQLVAGPILRYADTREALERVPRWRPGLEDTVRSLTFIIIGLAYKVLLADSVSGFIGPLLEDLGRLTAVDATYVTLAYSLQIYFDFYGYSLIAIGLGILFGFRFPDNFNRPYSALNPREFWRRWHITLSYWIRDYLYVPLGGNRRYLVNILIVFAVCGLWHGAGWNFIAWGVYHGALVLAYHGARLLWDRLPVSLQWMLTFGSVSFGWTFFLLDLGWWPTFVQAYARHGESQVSVDAWLVLVCAALVAAAVRPERAWHVLQIAPRGRAVALGGGLGILAVLVLVFLDRSTTFIYFRF